MPSTQVRNFCFTRFSTDTDLYQKLYDDGYVTYIAWGEETCPTTQRTHHQGFLNTAKKTTLLKVAKELGNAHVEIIRGTLAQNTAYCSKEGTLQELGTCPKQGRRNIEELASAIREGTQTIDDVLETDPMAYHQYGRTLIAVADAVMLNQRRAEMTKGVWLYGSTGVGKSHMAHQMAKEIADEEPYIYIDDKGWWDTYTGQKVVIIDDFRGSIPYGRLLTLVDKWHTCVSRRARPPMPFLAKMVIVTLSMSPEQVYNNLSQEDSLAQLHRRFEVKQL